MSKSVLSDNLLKNLTDEQKQFVEFNNNNALVSASAGSGKTSTMIKKLVTLLVYYDVNIEELLVVTFTNSAGAELKQKLYEGLLKEINTTTNQDIIEKKDELYEKLEKISSCDIGTLHSVCNKYILKYFYKCNIDPNSNILSETDTTYLIDESINKVIEKYSNDDEYYDIFKIYAANRNYNNIVTILKNLYYFLMSIPNIDKFKTEVINNPNNKCIDTNICAEYIFKTLKNNLNEYEKGFSELLIESDANEFTKLSLVITNWINFIKGYKNCKSFKETCDYINNTVLSRMPSNKVEGILLDIKERVKALRKDFGEELEDIKKIFGVKNIDDLMNMEESTNKIVNKLLAMVDDVKSYYDSLKKIKNGLDYNDLEHKMLEILEDKDVLLELKNKYKFIFVDEYQDINNVQEEILLKLSNNNNMYMIGDVKQSIYGFRLCTPDIFIQKYYDYKNNNKNGKTIEFNKNFRSVDTILQFVNYVFQIIGTKDTMGINYKESAMLQCGMNKTNNFDGDKSVEVVIINKEKNPDEGDKEKTNEDDLILPNENQIKEAKVIVNKVKEYLGKDYFNLKTKELSKINYKDIAILIRDKSKLLQQVYIELLNNNIPVNAEIKLDLLSEYEIKVLISYLRIMSNIQDDISLTTVLHSNIVGLNNEELATIRKYHNDCLNEDEKYDEYKKMYSTAVLNYAKNNDDKISFKINKLFSELDEFRFELNSKNLSEIVRLIITKYDLENYFYSFVDGNQKLINLNLFLSLLNNENYSHNLTKFLSYIDLLESKEYVCNIENGSNAVTITTMHKSKGLDYPVVIAVGLGSQFSNQSMRESAIVTNEFGVGLKYYNIDDRYYINTLSFNANKLNKKLNEKKEQLRLFYVALTRAENYLCLIGTYELENIEKLKYKEVLGLNSFIELVIYSILKNEHIDNISNDRTIKINDKISFNINIIDDVDINDEENVKKLQIKENVLFEDIDVINELKRNFAYIYPYSKSMNIALKTSVTGLMNEDYVEINESPKELKINETVDNSKSLEIGNAYHLIMENLDYSSEVNINELVSNLILNNLINSSIEKYIDIDKIKIAKDTIKSLLNKDTKILREQQFIIRDKHCNLIKDSTDETMVMVQGVIDLVLLNNDETILIDFKTNRTNDEEFLINKYNLQLSLYTYALEKAKSVKVKNKFLYSFYLNKLIEVK